MQLQPICCFLRLINKVAVLECGVRPVAGAGDETDNFTN